MDPQFFAYINKTEFTLEDLKQSLQAALPSLPTSHDVAGKVVVVTGANTGIGFEIAKAFASMKPKHLIMACRNAEKANTALTAIKEVVQGGGGDVVVEVVELDLASYKSTKNFAKNFVARGLPLDILVSNAGVATFEWVLTEDGNDIQMQVNHLSNMLMVLMLTPALKLSTHARIVMVSSYVHFWASRPEPSDLTPIQTVLTKPENLKWMPQYSTSKLMNVLFAHEYARRCPYKTISICSANPGLTKTDLGHKDPITGQPDGSAPMNVPKRSAYDGAKTILDAALRTDIVNGAYYSEMQESRRRTTTQGEVADKFGENVWSDSLKHLKAQIADAGLEDWALRE